jgi:hypothetical protein
MNKKWLVLLPLCTLPALVFPQQPQPAEPDSHQKWTQQDAGRWIGQGEIKASPFGPAGTISYTEDVDVAPEGRFLVMHWDWKHPQGEGKGLTVMGYHSQRKAYRSWTFDFATGYASYKEGPMEGNTLTLTSPEFERDGKVMKTRYVSMEITPTSGSFKMEYSSDGGPWVTYMEGNKSKIEIPRPE